MIENAGVKPIVERVAEQATGQPSVAPNAAEASDAARFQEALHGARETAPTEASAGPETVEVSPVEPAAASPGDSILQSLQRMRSDYQGAASKVENLSPANGSLSMQDLLRTQMELNQASMQVDLTAKVVGKVTQGIETLIKSQ
ncbi:MAG TPA: type III secretion system inner rod subunit SctI [Candidatus Competibacter sp.]|nr:EscI/YscI/HrpB family type III secretion system inner rod protein [Candidatus Competibacteraceae bacterium]HRE55473.1 type III secretion system inner rod subunit SctI [Candidatus Competibacter sp.]HUM95861.1 type III secretion system inner rod subunit SctI [Candidatus Competibacter sp.]